MDVSAVELAGKGAMKAGQDSAMQLDQMPIISSRAHCVFIQPTFGNGACYLASRLLQSLRFLFFCLTTQCSHAQSLLSPPHERFLARNAVFFYE